MSCNNVASIIQKIPIHKVDEELEEGWTNNSLKPIKQQIAEHHNEGSIQNRNFAAYERNVHTKI